MIQKRKLQVFVSSTYIDLREERQAAVEAVLTAGHIPAGMELFAAGDESQMEVIKRWIEESDVYLLILGGRYGSIDPKSGKSYVQLEYEYALNLGKPLFAVVITDDHLEEKVKANGTAAIEREHPDKLRDFRTLVLSRIVRFWRDPRDIKLTVLETLSELDRRENLVGWTRAGESVAVGALAEEVARLSKENAILRSQTAGLSSGNAPSHMGLTYGQIYQLLVQSPIESAFDEQNQERLQKIATLFGDMNVGLLHALWLLSELFLRKGPIKRSTPMHACVDRLIDYQLVQYAGGDLNGSIFMFTEEGHRFFMRLRVENANASTDALRLARSS